MTLQPKLLQWSCLPYEGLHLAQLYDLLSLRQQVFVVEQQCIFLDTDGKDQTAWHWLGYTSGGDLAAYCRLLPPDLAYIGYTSIGRVATHTDYRSQKYGHELMRRAIAFLDRQFPDYPIRIGAQNYLLRFYTAWGFVADGEPYIEDGIWHTEMVRQTCTP